MIPLHQLNRQEQMRIKDAYNAGLRAQGVLGQTAMRDFLLRKLREQGFDIVTTGTAWVFQTAYKEWYAGNLDLGFPVPPVRLDAQAAANVLFTANDVVGQDAQVKFAQQIARDSGVDPGPSAASALAVFRGLSLDAVQEVGFTTTDAGGTVLEPRTTVASVERDGAVDEPVATTQSVEPGSGGGGSPLVPLLVGAVALVGLVGLLAVVR